MGHLKSTELPESLVHPAGFDREPRRSGGRAWVWILSIVVVLGFKIGRASCRERV